MADTTTPPLLARLGHDGRPVRPLRRDASRNRQRALDAARRLFAERGGEVTMEDVAAAAGIGKGTLYRGFPTRAALASAVLDESARGLQRDVLAGLGVGDRGPVAALVVFLERLHRFTLEHLDLFCIAAEGAGLYRASPAYLWQRQTVAGLLDQAARRGESPPLDLDVVPDMLLAALAPDLVRFTRDHVGADPGRVAGALEVMVRGVTAPTA
jgi:AcrR family transcriptional regulator